MTDCSGLVVNQFVVSHQSVAAEEGSTSGVPIVSNPPDYPPPLYPRANVAPGFFSARADVCDNSCRKVTGRVEDPPVLPPREPRLNVKSALSSSVPTPPPRLANASSSNANRRSCDLMTRKTKSENFCREPLPNFRVSSPKRDVVCSRSTSAQQSFTAQEDLINGSTNVKTDENLFQFSRSTGAHTPKSIEKRLRMDLSPPSVKNSLGVVNLKTCMSNVLATGRTQNSISRGDSGEVPSSVLANQIIPLSQWPIPVVVIPSAATPVTQPADNRVPLEWIGSKRKEAVANEYVEAPSLHSPSLRVSEHISISPSLSTLLQTCSNVVTTQPGVSLFVKDHRSVQTKSDGSETQNSGWAACRGFVSPTNKKAVDYPTSLPPPQSVEPIICKSGLVCHRCKKCRCDGCVRSRRLPRRWIGPPGRRCMCSAEEVARICSCMCCIQALFYHCFFHPDDDDDLMMEPCACCERPRCCLRWSVMTALLPVLPCLLCYCPLQCLVGGLSLCYDSCTNRGCRCTVAQGKSSSVGTGELGSGCERNTSSTSSGATRDLLVESESSSA